MRPDNECYPNRYLVAKTLVQKLKIDPSLRNENELPARKLSELAQVTVDAVHPQRNWTNDDVITWLEGLGEWTKNNRQWSAHFIAQSVDGELLVGFLAEVRAERRAVGGVKRLRDCVARSLCFSFSRTLTSNLSPSPPPFPPQEDTGAFTEWLERTHHDLAHREVYKRERGYVKQGLKVLLKEFKAANAYRRKMEKPFILEQRRLRRIEFRKERKELAIMEAEENEQMAWSEKELRSSDDLLAEENYEQSIGGLRSGVEGLTNDIERLKSAIDAGEGNQAAVGEEKSEEDDPKKKKKKRRKSVVEKEEAEKAAKMAEAASQVSDLKNELDKAEKDLIAAEKILEEAEMQKEERDWCARAGRGMEGEGGARKEKYVHHK